ncbi:hypothetical protein DLD77_10415 [Chitinophaga alhagiae]|uniref:Uncharacterized protein n=1 Tax=Chitinophaga alhagiae TaxID=2203219 RepID=A0ABM6WE28_9BACT|nr:hypothetical protein DLD77_10415 [Chitinophaga alhagiae]
MLAVNPRSRRKLPESLLPVGLSDAPFCGDQQFKIMKQVYAVAKFVAAFSLTWGELRQRLG